MSHAVPPLIYLLAVGMNLAAGLYLVAALFATRRFARRRLQWG